MAGAMELEAYRRSAEMFLAALEREYYRHYAGLQVSLEIEPIYSRHRELFGAAAVQSLRELRDAAPVGGEEHRRLGMLLDFAASGHLGDRTKTLEAELARREAGLSFAFDGVRVGFRESAVLQANEPDPRRRALIERSRLDLIDAELRPLLEELTECRHAGAEELGWGSYRELCGDCKSIDLDELHRQTEAFRVSTDVSYPEVLEPELRRTLGIGLGELKSADLPSFFRAPRHDRSFPTERLLASFAQTLRDLGIDIESQPGLILDIEPRPKKSPRAFCAPVRTPGEVYLVISPFGGRDDFEALFHEGGHAQHAAHVDPGLPFEFRYLGDNAIGETYAFLLQHLIEDPHWLELHLGVRNAAELSGFARAKRLLYIRRYAAKLAYELELHAPANGVSFDSLSHRYAELLSAALGVKWPSETFLIDVDPGFYCTAYLRAWTLETRLRAHLRERFGTSWFLVGEAGEELRELWRQGQRLTPEELLDQLTGERFEFAMLADDLGV
jgi:hypothetical protein